MNDLKFAFRQLLKNPGFTAVAVLTLALGIGLNVAVFSMANAVLWPPLNFPEPNQLVQLGEGDLLNGNRGGVSASNFRDWTEHARSFGQIAAMRTTALNLGGVLGECSPVLGWCARWSIRSFKMSQTQSRGCFFPSALASRFQRAQRALSPQ